MVVNVEEGKEREVREAKTNLYRKFCMSKPAGPAC